MALGAGHIASATKMHSKIDVGIFRDVMMATIFTFILSGFSFDFNTEATAHNNQS